MHWFELDLGAIYHLHGIRGRSNTVDDPTNVNVYAKQKSGDAYVGIEGGITTWQDTSTWVDFSLDKFVRFLKVEVTTTENMFSEIIKWGHSIAPFITIFDVDITYMPPILEGSGTGWEMLSILGTKNFNLSDLLVLYNGTYYTWTQATTSANEESEPLILTWVYEWDYAGQNYQSVSAVAPAEGYWFYWYHHGALFVKVGGGIKPVICTPLQMS